jgi:hypothetical protein
VELLTSVVLHLAGHILPGGVPVWVMAATVLIAGLTVIGMAGRFVIWVETHLFES